MSTRRNTSTSSNPKDDPEIFRFRIIYSIIGVVTIAAAVIVLYESLHPEDVNKNWCNQDDTDVSFGIGWQLSCALTFIIALVVALGIFEMVKGDWSLLGTYTITLLILTILQLVFCIYFSAVDDFNCFAVGFTPYLLFVLMIFLLVVLVFVSRRLAQFLLTPSEEPYERLAPAKKYGAIEVNKNAFRSFWSAPVHEIGGKVEVSEPSTNAPSAVNSTSGGSISVSSSQV